MTYRWIDLGNGRQVFRRDHEYRGPRSDLPSPMLISDHIDDLWHPATGEKYDSKAKFRKVAKDHGLIEVGTEQQTDTRHYDHVSREDVGEAIRKVNQGYRPSVRSEALD